MRTIAGRLVRELLRELPADSGYRTHLELCMKFINGELIDGHKIYSLHEPDVLCISKGKEHKKYEFDNKAQDFVGSHLRLVAFYCMTESICVSVLACGVRP